MINVLRISLDNLCIQDNRWLKLLLKLPGNKSLVSYIYFSNMKLLPDILRHHFSIE
jgi:hypothetical protein